MKKIIVYILLAIALSTSSGALVHAENDNIPADWGNPTEEPSNTLKNDNNTYISDIDKLRAEQDRAIKVFQETTNSDIQSITRGLEEMGASQERIDEVVQSYNEKRSSELHDMQNQFANEETALLNKRTYIPSAIPKPTTLPGPTDTDRQSLTSEVLPRIAIGIIGFVGAAALVFVIIGGLRFATAYGDEEAAEKAKKQVTYAIVGFLLAMLSYTIVTIITNLNFGG